MPEVNWTDENDLGKISQGYALLCAVCAQEFSDAMTIEDMDIHFKYDHPEEPKIRLITKWKGKGAPPKQKFYKFRRHA